MKTFVNKTLFIFLMLIILFNLTIGPLLRNFEQKIRNLKSKENIEYIKDELREELKTAVNKENYLDEEDRKLIIAFIEKLKSELNNQSQN